MDCDMFDCDFLELREDMLGFFKFLFCMFIFIFIEGVSCFWLLIDCCFWIGEYGNGFENKFCFVELGFMELEDSMLVNDMWFWFGWFVCSILFRFVLVNVMFL